MLNLYSKPTTKRRSSRKIVVEIVVGTRKAKLVKDASGRQGWVQNRSYKDGKVNATTFQNAVESFNEASQAKAAAAAPVELKIIKRTDLAVCFEITVDFYLAEKTKTKTAWLPKSWLVDGKAKASDFNSKVEETFGTGSYSVLSA
jgi:SH3-like domain-containing protein